MIRLRSRIFYKVIVEGPSNAPFPEIQDVNVLLTSDVMFDYLEVFASSVHCKVPVSSFAINKYLVGRHFESM